MMFLPYPALKNAIRFRAKNDFFLITEHGKSMIDPRSLRSIDTFFENGMLLKDSRTTTAALAAVSPDGAPVFLKRCNSKGFSFTIRYLFRPARVFRAAAAAQELESIGIRTPKVLLVGERRSGLILKAGYIVTATAPEIHSVEWLIRETGAPEAFLDSFLPAAARITAKLHANRIEHGDLKIVNFYHTGKWSPESTYGIWDLDSVRIHAGRVPRSRVERELSRVVFSICMRAERNPCFPEELSSPDKLAARFIGLYCENAEPGAVLPDASRVARLASERVEYRRKHPYQPQKGKML